MNFQHKRAPARLTVMAADATAESRWTQELATLSGFPVQGASSGGETGQIVFVDAETPKLDGVLDLIDRRGRAVFLMVDSALARTDQIEKMIENGIIDDVLVYPFRKLEMQSRLRQYQQILMWGEVGRLNASFSELIQGLSEDLNLAERLQKGRLPVRFQDIKGLRIHHRYLAGMRSGGDHFDLADSRDGSHLSMMLSDSSSYGLSSAVLSAIMRVAIKLSTEEVRSSQETVLRIYDELALALGEKDQLSLFYGTLSKKDFKLRYLNLGSSAAFISPVDGAFQAVPSQGGAITKAVGVSTIRSAVECEIRLSPNDRLALVSDGFVQRMGGVKEVCTLLDNLRQKEPVDSLNELVFRVKAQFKEPDDMPEQDCTAVIFDVDPKLLRLA